MKAEEYKVRVLFEIRETMPEDFIQVMLEREAPVLELPIQEGYFEDGGKLHEKTQNGIV